MRTKKSLLVGTVTIALVFLASLAFAGHGGGKAHEAVHIEGGEYVTIAGTIIDSHKEPIAEAVIEVTLNGHAVAHVETAHNGHYLAEFMVEKDAMQTALIEMKVHKASFKTEIREIQGTDFARKGDHYYITEGGYA
ncbi:MAG: hypothetical protein KAU38_15210 [Desulfobacterales bacterium]|nr:hypothetical protein [Desulfobacterales bacterium]